VALAALAGSFRAMLYYGGTDAEIQRGTAIFAQAGSEFGYM